MRSQPERPSSRELAIRRACIGFSSWSNTTFSRERGSEAEL
jgi:hypothetical protein